MALMAIVAVGVSPTNPRSNVGVLYLGPRRYWFGMELGYTGGLKRSRERECLAVLAHKTITPVDDDKPFTLGVESSGPIHQVQGTAPKVFLKEMDLLPKPLSATNLSASPDNDRGVQIAYQGKPGGYSETAALKTYPKCEAVPYDQYEVAFKAVELWLVDKAVVPIENTVAGSMHHNYDLLLRHRLHIIGELKLAVNHRLLELRGVKKDELKHVLSHPQDEDSVTHFLILAREPLLPGTDRPYKTSIVFSLEKGPNALFKVLALFELRDICMSNVESRPLKQLPFRAVDDSNKSTAKCFDYLFYIDFEASMADPRVQYALGYLEEYASFLRVLGCYPMDKSL